MSLDEVYAVPGSRTVIDFIRPDGLTCILGQTEAEVQARCHGAVRMSFEAWRQAEGDRQHAPFTWDPTTREQFEEMKNVLPPACWTGKAFLVGEPMSHSARTGEAMYSAGGAEMKPLSGTELQRLRAIMSHPGPFGDFVAGHGMKAEFRRLATKYLKWLAQGQGKVKFSAAGSAVSGDVVLVGAPVWVQISAGLYGGVLYRLDERGGNMWIATDRMGDRGWYDKAAARKFEPPISCGCCTVGCVCRNHMDIPRGLRPKKCAVHSGTGAIEYLVA